MNLRLWLKRNFLRRGLRWLGEKAQRALFSSIRLPSLLARLPWQDWRSQRPTATTLLKHNRRLDLVGDQNARLDRNYADEIAPLNSLPDNATIAQLKAAIEALPNYDPQGQLFFPGDAYIAATQSYQHLAVEVVHRCRARRASNIFKNHPTLFGLAETTDEAETFLIYDRPAMAHKHILPTQKQGARKWLTLPPNG